MIIKLVENIFLYDIYHTYLKFKDDLYDRSLIMTTECLS
jgi:hypothetical protein